MPLTELWLSRVRTSRTPRPNGYDSPTSRHAPVAFGVKMAAYSPGGALKCARTACRARSTSSVDAAEAGFSECGFPKHRPAIRSAWARICAWAARLPARIQVGVLGRPQPVQQHRAPVAGVGGQEAWRLFWRPVLLGAAALAGPLVQGGGHDFPRMVSLWLAESRPRRCSLCRSSSVRPPQMPASWPLASAQFRQVALTGQPRQISLAVLTWLRADLRATSGKNSSGSASRQAAASRQSGRRSRAGRAAEVDVLMALAVIPRPLSGP